MLLFVLRIIISYLGVLADFWRLQDSTIPWIVAIVSFPVMLGKQFINVVQFIKASKWLAEGDLEARRAQGLPRPKKTI